MLIMFVTNGTGNAQGWQGEYHTSGVGLKKTERQNNETLIYPNPSDGMVIIEKFAKQNSEITIQLLNLIGETKFNEKYKLDSGNNKIELNLNALPESTYFLILTNSNQQEIRKLVIIK